MRVVGIKELKNKLSEYVKLAAGGERVLVTDRTRVVAELIAPRPDPDPRMRDPRWAAAVRQGLITPRLIDSREPPANHPVASLEQILAELDADRADR